MQCCTIQISTRNLKYIPTAAIAKWGRSSVKGKDQSHIGPRNYPKLSKNILPLTKSYSPSSNVLNNSRKFEIHTDSSNYQIGAIISQGGRLVVYLSKKIFEAQQKYPTTDQELLAIVECLKQYKTMLLGQNIVVGTDDRRASDRVLRQRLLLEEYAVKLKFIQEI